MSVKITRCPQCQTSFKVSDEHLSIAAGAVRCGSCLHVFQALDHLVPQPEAIFAPATASSAATLAASAATATAETQPAATKKRLELDDDVLISDDMEIDDDDEDEAVATADIATFNSDLLLGEDIPAQTFEVPDDLNVELAAAEDWQQVLAASTESAAVQDSDDYSDLFDDEEWDDLAEQNAEDLSVSEMQLDDEAPAATVETASANNGSDLSEFDDFDSDQLLAELQATIADLGDTQRQIVDNVAKLTDETAAAPSASVLRFGSEAPEFKAPNAHADEVHVQLDDAETVAAEAMPPSAASAVIAPPETAHAEVVTDSALNDLGLNPAELPPIAPQKPLIDQIEPLPVDIGRFEREPTDWAGIAKGAAACIALVAVFFAQYVFFNFNDLSHDLQARPWLSKVCSTGICELPALDPARVVKISNLIVRTHPTEPNALAIDAILLNVENEPVPVPELELLFSTMEKLPLASRRFSPAEFLAGEMSGQAVLPPGRPVHIALAIVEPGPDAVNWTLSVKRAAK